MNTLLIKMFNAALVEGQPTISEFKAVNTKALQLGYLVPQEICNASVLSFLTEQTINPNATFYKTFEDVTSKSHLELLFDQVLHYLTTYGTGFEMGNGYVPNDGETAVIDDDLTHRSDGIVDRHCGVSELKCGQGTDSLCHGDLGILLFRGRLIIDEFDETEGEYLRVLIYGTCTFYDDGDVGGTVDTDPGG